MPDDSGFDRHELRATGDQAICAHGGDAAATEGRPRSARQHAMSRDTTAGALGGGEGLGNERPRALGARGADAPGPRPEVIVPGHRKSRQCVKTEARPMCWWFGAHCTARLHIAGSAKNISKNNRPTGAHIARFCLALVRSCSALPLRPSAPLLCNAMRRACLRDNSPAIQPARWMLY